MIRHTTKLIVLASFLVVSPIRADAQSAEMNSAISIVPKPVSMSKDNGSFLINEHTTIVCDEGDAQLDSLAHHLASQIRAATGYQLSFSSAANSGSIVLSVGPRNKKLPNEGYTLNVTPKEIRIDGFDEAGTFYGIQTFFQLLPPEIASSQVVHGMIWTVPCVKIKDYPRFGWRGMHLDVGRHFFAVSFIKQYLDLMAMFKLNMFHWHLTEDQGWRIEIKKYPRLTQIGGWRKETTGDGVPHGGYYTQDQIRDIVAYAAQRHIEIIPEIEMPGHAKAALAAYPEFSCRQAPLEVRTTWGVEKDVFCAGNDSTFAFLEDVLREVFDLFPGKYVHIGGDECPKDRWKECPRCQARMKAEGLKDEQELQSYFIKRIEKFVNANGKRVVGWDEILEGGLAPNATVMSWRGTQGGIDAAKSGHDVVMTPTSNCYFDYAQALTGEEDKTEAFLPMDSIYNYEPIPRELSGDEAAHVLGSQGNLWTEYVPDARRAEYMLLPRMCALSEMVWTQRDLRNYDDFVNRMGDQYDRLMAMDVNFRVPAPFSLGGNCMSFNDTVVTFSELPRYSKTCFTLDGSEPSLSSSPYVGPILLDHSTILKAKLFLSSGLASNTVWIDFSKLDSASSGLQYEYGVPGPDSNIVPQEWVKRKSGIAYEVSLPENPATPGPFEVRFKGFLAIEKPGLYTFYLRADSGSVLSINNVELVNGGPPDRHWWRSGKMELNKGKYPLSVHDLELDEWRGVSLEYDGPGIERQVIPARLFSRR